MSEKAEFEDLGAVEHAKNLYKQWISLAEEDDIPFFLYTPKREERKSFHSPIAKRENGRRTDSAPLWKYHAGSKYSWISRNPRAGLSR